MWLQIVTTPCQHHYSEIGVFPQIIHLPTQIIWESFGGIKKNAYLCAIKNASRVAQVAHQPAYKRIVGNGGKRMRVNETDLFTKQ